MKYYLVLKFDLKTNHIKINITMGDRLEQKVDDVISRCREVQEKTQRMVSRFETELLMRKLQRELEERQMEEQRDRQRVIEWEQRNEE